MLGKRERIHAEPRYQDDDFVETVGVERLYDVSAREIPVASHDVGLIVRT
jgi:hypothetical protein